MSHPTKKRYAMLGLCEARHEMPVKAYFFPQKVDPLNVSGLEEQSMKKIQEIRNCGFDGITLYTTGLTQALASVVKACAKTNTPLRLMHYDRDTRRYYPQDVM